MSVIDERIEGLLKSPLGCAFLVVANESGLKPREIADPIISLYMGAYAARDVEVWRSDREEILPDVLRRGPQYADLAQALLEEPATAWWFAPLDLEQQVWVPLGELHRAQVGGQARRDRARQPQATFEGTPPEPARMGAPQHPPSNFERYAQKVAEAFYTSSLMEQTSSLLVAYDVSVGDIGIGSSPPPIAAWRLCAGSSARVYEVDGPLAWHNLCMRYPADGTTRVSPNPDFSGDTGRVVPNWSTAVADWDAVHLTFGGWLTIEQVRIESPSGWTYHWGWDAEQTMWLRWMFTDVERMPDHHPMESPLHRLVHPVYQYRNFKPRG